MTITNTTRSSKPWTKWTNTDLQASNIEITFQDAPTFFCDSSTPNSPDPAPNSTVTPTVDLPDFLNTLTADDATNER
ncbi:hypothetical protein MD484_g7972, partial [Candolleomyces efflorescens]